MRSKLLVPPKNDVLNRVDADKQPLIIIFLMVKILLDFSLLHFSLISVFMMKSSNLFVLLAFAVIKENVSGSIKKNDKNSFVASAFGEIIEKFYEKIDHRVDVLCYPCKNMTSAYLLNEILKHQMKVAFRVFKPAKNIQINASTIMIFDTRSDHEIFVKNISFDLFSTTEKYYIIYFPKSKSNQHEIIPNMKYKNFNYLTNFNRTHLMLFTMKYFNKIKCNRTLTEIINLFNRTNLKWNKNEDFFSDKFKNFNGCPLNFGRKTFSLQNAAPTKGKKFGGEIYEMNEAIAKTLNIKTNYVDCPLKGSKVCNKTYTLEPEMHLELAFISNYNYSSLEQLVSFNFENYEGFLIPPG
jgi:hypothetical protein